MLAHRILNIASPNPHLQNIFGKKLGISRVLAQILINRGIRDVSEAEKFLKVKLEHLLDPHALPDVDKAVKIIKRAVKNKERVMIFGDYDVDGVTSVTLLENTLSKIGLDVMHYLPHRVKEGYGLNKNILGLLKAKNIKLLITVDCGTANLEEIKELRGSHIEVIVTDHHEPINGEVAPASCMINPKLKDSTYGYRDLAGVGVVYKFCQAIAGKNLWEDLDLVTLGTIADIVPLTGENRIIVKEGLICLSQTKRIGLKTLIKNSGIKDKKITSAFVSYILSPRINASGRLDSAEAALDLLMSQKEAEAENLAKIMETYNRQRQKIEGKILEEAKAIIDREVNFKEHKVIVVAKDDWHQGVLGIVASKLSDKFYRPAIVISKTSGLCKGSGRSIKNFHLFQALLECRDFLETFGGHAYAAGLVISKHNIEGFKNSINRLAKEKLLLEDLIPKIDIDIEVTLSEISDVMLRELETLEPYGNANPEPLFYTRNLKLKGEPQVLGKNTLKFWVTDGDITHQAIGFGMGGFKESLQKADYFDLVYTPGMDNWQGEDSILLQAQDIFLGKG